MKMVIDSGQIEEVVPEKSEDDKTDEK